MTRTMYDSTNAFDIPTDAQLVGGYVDGIYAWPSEWWDRFPASVHVPISIAASGHLGLVLDVETGAASPADVPDWLRQRRAAGVDPTVYVNHSNWQQVVDFCNAAGIALPHWWVAYYDNVAELPVGLAAKQYANEALTGHHYDLSVVADFWPGVDVVTPAPPAVPVVPDDGVPRF